MGKTISAVRALEGTTYSVQGGSRQRAVARMIFVGGHGLLNQVVDALLKSAVPSQKAIVPASKAASIQLFELTPGRGRQRPSLQNGNYAEKKINRQ
ncbi:hypothetical protein ON010_g5335 [Phytophthora cinnamomi]|nr:hypothetical protein ON010_g5335 [Phytophthora cinnamomi]